MVLILRSALLHVDRDASSVLWRLMCGAFEFTSVALDLSNDHPIPLTFQSLPKTLAGVPQIEMIGLAIHFDRRTSGDFFEPATLAA